ncbi:MAG TPA: helicase HerA-like domain-containing protein [Micavibrio sp.]|nr:helicase HerA-like domain-containing protein [Micavibrio sp.]
MSADIFIGAETGNPDYRQFFPLKYANRHGLIAGATGTGKTITLQSLAEGFSKNGVPVFMADVKGDLSGLCQPSAGEDFIAKRNEQIAFTDFRAQAFPAAFWDLYGEKGHPVRTTVSEVGPLLLARMLELNETQEGVLNIAFRHADAQGLLLLDLKDLRALLNAMHENASDISRDYGQVSKPSIATIQRQLLRLEEQGGDQFFGEPALNLSDLMRTDMDGKGYVNILAADRLMNAPRLYATFLLWMLSELFEELPEAGDLPQPKLVFFFDEAHLLFTDAPKSLLEKIEQVVRLIRSKGVGIYFVTQNPQDIPDSVLGQLGNRVQHALRAFTPQQNKFIKQAAQTYRPNPAFRVDEVISDMAVGEALVSTLEEKGNPSMVRRILIRPPESKVGPCSPGAKSMAMKADGVGAKYDAAQDRESAYEILKERAEGGLVRAGRKAPQETQKPPGRQRDGIGTKALKAVLSSVAYSIGSAVADSIFGKGRKRSVASKAAKSAVRNTISSVGRNIGREILRGNLGSMKR